MQRAMQSMASVCYADDQARSSEGETSREKRGKGLVLAWSSIRGIRTRLRHELR